MGILNHPLKNYHPLKKKKVLLQGKHLVIYWRGGAVQRERKRDPCRRVR